MSEFRLGIDVACRSDHRASLADDRGEFVWSGWRFRTTVADLERLWAKLSPTKPCISKFGEDRLDSRVLARLPLVHPEGLRAIDDLGPAEPLKRAVRHRSALGRRRVQAMQRLDALIELLGRGWADVLGSGDYTKTALGVLERYADPKALKRLGRKRLTALPIRTSRGHFHEAKADELLAAADETIEMWSAGGLDFAELARTSPPK